MKQLEQDETEFLFEWVKNWYPTEKKPKIAICLLTKQEWSDYYNSCPKENLGEIAKNAEEHLLKKYPEIKPLLEKIDNLQEKEKLELMKKLKPHAMINDMPNAKASELYKEWMNEESGIVFSYEEEKQLEEMKIKPNPIWKSFPDYDFVVLISDFFNEEQQKAIPLANESLKQKGYNFEFRELHTYNTIFHELIHVVEHCNKEKIFTSNDKAENEKITFPITIKYLIDR
jgi:hypothetical protein